MFRKCCVPRCDSQRQDIKLHKFPVREEARDKWLKCINCEKLRSMAQTDTVDKAYVCHKHFEKSFISARNRLKLGAYPTLFSDLEIASGKPTNSFCSFTESVQNQKQLFSISDHDHTYVKKCHYENTSVFLEDDRVSIPDFNQSSTSSQTITVGTTSGFLDKDPLMISSSENNACNHQKTGIEIELTHSTTIGTLDTDQHCNEIPSQEKLGIEIELTHSTTIGTLDTDQHCNEIPSQEKLDHIPHRYSSIRLIKDVKSLTPKCKLLYKAFKKARRQRDILRRSIRAIEVDRERSFKKLTAKMNPLAEKLLWMQVKLCMKTKKGRRFTMDEKLVGLAIYKQSPKSYNFLKKIFILPSKTTLKKMIRNLNIESGINPQIFRLIKK